MKQAEGTAAELVTRFHEQVIELVRKYQFRDRNAICCHGVSVSQCYLLEELSRHGKASPSELAEVLCITGSTVTRLVDQLVDKGHVERIEDPDDRRVRRVALTASGRQLFQRLWGEVLASEKAILEYFPPENREMLVRFLSLLNESVDHWREDCRCSC